MLCDDFIWVLTVIHALNFVVFIVERILSFVRISSFPALTFCPVAALVRR